MATVNLSWTTPTSLGDVDNIEIWRWAGLSATATADLETLITAAATSQAGLEATLADTVVTYSDTTAPIGDLTYATVSRNSAGYKLEGGAVGVRGHADVTTT
jgi:hypothetical protein